jgi:aspartate/tyrosine/aromatic aminotransferase
MVFQTVSDAPPDPIFGLGQAFAADVRPHKVDLMVGIYKDEELEAELFPSVKRGKELTCDLLADYLPMDGWRELVELTGPLVFGEAVWGKEKGRIYGAHTAGGTGSLRAGMEFLAQQGMKTVYVPNPSWPNHRAIVERCGCRAENYPYYSREKRGFDFDGMVGVLEKLPPKSVVVLHACCHNPTGCDPTMQEWKEISLLMKERGLIPFFDCAYQGLGEGIEEDARAVRLFVDDGHEMLIAYSCSKNFSMYCQRVGALFVVTESGAVRGRVGSQVKKMIRALYSNPPAHGALIVSEVLRREELRRLWKQDLEAVRRRLNGTREQLTERLMKKDGRFAYLQHRKGMFSFLDMDPAQAQQLIDQFAVYILANGRISISGLNAKNIDYVVDSILGVCR